MNFVSLQKIAVDVQYIDCPFCDEHDDFRNVQSCIVMLHNFGKDCNLIAFVIFGQNLLNLIVEASVVWPAQKEVIEICFVRNLLNQGRPLIVDITCATYYRLQS